MAGSPKTEASVCSLLRMQEIIAVFLHFYYNIDRNQKRAFAEERDWTIV